MSRLYAYVNGPATCPFCGIDPEDVAKDPQSEPICLYAFRCQDRVLLCGDIDTDCPEGCPLQGVNHVVLRLEPRSARGGGVGQVYDAGSRG